MVGKNELFWAISLFIVIYLYHMHLLHYKWIIMAVVLLYWFFAHTMQSWLLGIQSKLALCPAVLIILKKYFLNFWAHKMFRLFCVFPATTFESAISAEIAGFHIIFNIRFIMLYLYLWKINICHVRDLYVEDIRYFSILLIHYETLTLQCFNFSYEGDITMSGYKEHILFCYTR